MVRGPIRNRFVDLCRNLLVDLLETGLWTYWKPVCGPIGNRFVDLLETGSSNYRKLVCGPIGNQFVPGANLTLPNYTFDGAGVPKLVRSLNLT